MSAHEPVPEPVLVTAREHLEEIVPELRGAARLALDIESNGFYAYREKVCLLQVSTPERDYVVDPIAISDLSCLGPLTASPSIEKIFHAGEYDVLCLKRDYRFEFKNLFDTMIASRLLGCKELGLAAAIERHFGVRLSKKLQRADWGQRPLSREQIRYAQLDTHYLIRLADIQRGLLKEKGRLDDAAEAFQELSELRPVVRDFDPEGFWRLVGKETLSPSQVAALREIYLFREEQAQAKNRAPFRVMSEELMLRVAREMPGSLGELSRIKGATPYLLQRYGHGLLKAVARGREAIPPAQPPKPERPRKSLKERRLFEVLRQWRKARAEEEGVEPVVVFSTDALWEMARLAAHGGDLLQPLSTLKRGRYGAELLKVLKARHR